MSEDPIRAQTGIRGEARAAARSMAATDWVGRTGRALRMRWVLIVAALVIAELAQRLTTVPMNALRLQVVLIAVALHSALLGIGAKRWRWRAGEGDLPGWRIAHVPLILALAPIYVLNVLLTAVDRVGFEITRPFNGAAGVATVPRPNPLARFLLPRTLRDPRLEADVYEKVLVASAQIIVDIAALSLLIHYAGGLETPLALLFIYYALLASTLLSRRAAFVFTNFALALSSGIGLGELLGWLPHHPLPFLRVADAFRDPSLVAAQLVMLGATLNLTTHFVSSVVARLRDGAHRASLVSQELSTRVGELQMTCSRLGQSDRAKSLYMRTVAHELKSPLATIQSLLNVVLSGLVGDVSDKAREMVERAERRTGELAQATQDLLTLAKVREGQFVTERIPVDLYDVAADVTADLRSVAMQASVTLTLEPASSVGRVIADPVAIRQLVRNLVSNAIRYNRPGGSVRVRVFETDDDFVEVEVEDTGIGILSRDMARIFDEFYRSDAAKRHVAGGTGLGLPIVKAVAEQHGGRVSVRSVEGKGSCFAVRLPRQATASGPSALDAEAD